MEKKSNKDKALEFTEELVKMHPDRRVSLQFCIRVFSGTEVEKSEIPSILDKTPYDFTMAVYSIDNINWGLPNYKQLYFDCEGEMHDYAPYKGGKLTINFNKTFTETFKSTKCDFSFSVNGLKLAYQTKVQHEYLFPYKLCLSYASAMKYCKTQLEVDFLRKCLEKDMKIEELNLRELDKARKIANLEDMLETHKEFINTIKELVNRNEE